MINPKVYIIIVNYTNWQDTLECLDSVIKSTYKEYSIIIIDNLSPNDSIRELANWATAYDHKVYTGSEFETAKPAELAKVNLVKNGKNTGFAAANNLALNLIKNLDCYAWLLNPDMIVETDALAELVKFADEQASTTIIGAVIRTFDEKKDIILYGGGKLDFRTATSNPSKNPAPANDLDYISGSSLFTHAGNFRTYGLLPEEYFLYWEETDWCYHAKLNGAQLKVCLAAICYDKISQVIGKGFLAHYYYTRNGLIFISKYKKEKLGLAWTAMYLKMAKRLILYQWDIAKGIKRGMIDFKNKRTHAI